MNSVQTSISPARLVSLTIPPPRWRRWRHIISISVACTSLFSFPPRTLVSFSPQILFTFPLQILFSFSPQILFSFLPQILLSFSPQILLSFLPQALVSFSPQTILLPSPEPITLFPFLLPLGLLSGHAFSVFLPSSFTFFTLGSALETMFLLLLTIERFTFLIICTSAKSTSHFSKLRLFCCCHGVCICGLFAGWLRQGSKKFGAEG